MNSLPHEPQLSGLINMTRVHGDSWDVQDAQLMPRTVVLAADPLTVSYEPTKTARFALAHWEAHSPHGGVQHPNRLVHGHECLDVVKGLYRWIDLREALQKIEECEAKLTHDIELAQIQCEQVDTLPIAKQRATEDKEVVVDDARAQAIHRAREELETHVRLREEVERLLETKGASVLPRPSEPIAIPVPGEDSDDSL